MSDLDAATSRTPDEPPLTVAVLGGTGPQGRGLGYRFARHGHRVVLGSRDGARAAATAQEVSARLGTVPGAGTVAGMENAVAVARCDVVVLAIPWEGHDELVGSLDLAGKTVVSCVNPLAFDRRGAHGVVIDHGEGSAAERAQVLAPESTVVGAFHHVSAGLLWSEQEWVEEDILCVGDSEAGKAVAMRLAAAVSGRPGISAGKLRLARQLEPFTAVLISINRRYRTDSGLAITGVDRAPVLP